MNCSMSGALSHAGGEKGVSSATTEGKPINIDSKYSEPSDACQFIIRYTWSDELRSGPQRICLIGTYVILCPISFIWASFDDWMRLTIHILILECMFDGFYEFIASLLPSAFISYWFAVPIPHKTFRSMSLDAICISVSLMRLANSWGQCVYTEGIHIQTDGKSTYLLI